MALDPPALLRRSFAPIEHRLTMRVRFTGAVLPGDTIRTELRADGEVDSLRATAVERDAVVLDKGRVDLRPINHKEN